jgi:NADH:ubiquinone oxidoreductase subunit 3 (subunit A)
MAAQQMPDDWVRIAIFAGISIVLTVVVLFVLRAIFPAFQYPLTIVTPYGAGVVACGFLGFVLSAWRRGAAPAANLAASLVCFVAPAVTLYAMAAWACRSVTLQCLH